MPYEHPENNHDRPNTPPVQNSVTANAVESSQVTPACSEIADKTSPGITTQEPDSSRLRSDDSINSSSSSKDERATGLSSSSRVGLDEKEHHFDHTSGKSHSGRGHSSVRRTNPRKTTHGRSQSHTKVSTRLSTSANAMPPHLNRSKSTDGIIPKIRPGIKRNNRSFTKLASLHPLTKTLSNNSITRGVSVQPFTKSISKESLKPDVILRKTNSNGSGKGVTATLTKSDSNTSIKSNKSSSSLRGLGTGARGSRSSASLKAANPTAHSTGLKTSAKRGKAILKLNEDSAYDGFEDASDISDSEIAPEPQVSQEMHPRPQPDADLKTLSANNLPEKFYDNSAPNNVSNLLSKETLEKEHYISQGLQQYNGENDSGDKSLSNNLYGGSLLLSQSTGMMRKIDSSNGLVNYSSINGSDTNKNVADTNSGFPFKSEKEETTTEPESVGAKGSVVQGSYQPAQTIFSNLQRHDSKYLSSIKQKRQQANPQNDTHGSKIRNNFSNYLAGSQSANAANNIETRTQQRLWLQRENSLLDVSAHMDPTNVGNFSNLSLNKLLFSQNYSSANLKDISGSYNGLTPISDNGPSPGESHSSLSSEAPSSVTNMLYLIHNRQQNSIQSRTEFERINREYITVRRHLNPVAQSLDRVRKYIQQENGLEVPKKNEKKNAYTSSINSNSFSEYASNRQKREEEASLIINKLWQEALISSSSSVLSLRNSQLESLQPQSKDQSLSQNSNLQPYNRSHDTIPRNESTLAGMARQSRRGMAQTSSRSSVPTTRAVKLNEMQSVTGHEPNRG